MIQILFLLNSANYKEKTIIESPKTGLAKGRVKKYICL